MGTILMEGLAPLADDVRLFMSRRFPGRNVYAGLDSAILIGDPSVIATGLLLVPVELILAIVLIPVGNRTLPFIDLADGPAVAAMVVPLVAGDIFLALILCAIVMGLGLMFATALAPAISRMIVAISSTAIMPPAKVSYTVMSDAAVPISYVLYYIFKTPIPTAIFLCLIFVVALYFVKERFPLRE
jgi:PTS system galactitol-specific IIC component